MTKITPQNNMAWLQKFDDQTQLSYKTVDDNKAVPTDVDHAGSIQNNMQVVAWSGLGILLSPVVAVSSITEGDLGEFGRAVINPAVMVGQIGKSLVDVALHGVLLGVERLRGE